MPDLHLMLVDGKVTEVDMGPMLARHRREIIGYRAAAVGQVVEALAVESIDIAELLDASGLPEPGRDAACYLALSLRLAELGGPDGE
jgi:hypothetical protein